jgi:D-alanyl-D-alanine carboxypeptidase (penicillin-binding protein 5/6)
VDVPPELAAPAWILVECANGIELAARGRELKIPPASLTKLLTCYLALEAAARGELSLDDMVTIDERDDYTSLPVDSTRMGLVAGAKVRIRDLISGACVASGNDAARALARSVSGDLETFVESMNARASELGMTASRFLEPSGLTSLNTSCAGDMALLSFAYVRDFPSLLDEFNGRATIKEPDASGAPSSRTISNLNPLVFDYPGCDGLKTGYIHQSGSHIIATAERDGTRFVAVVMGRTTGPSVADQARALLDFAFATYVTAEFSIEVPAWPLGSTSNSLRFAVEDGVRLAKVALTTRRVDIGKVRLRWETTATSEPVVVATLEGKVLARIPCRIGDP